MKKLLLLFLAIITGFLFVGCSNEAGKSENLKVALALTGPKTDGGWNQIAYEGVEMAADKLNAEIVFSENVKSGDYERILRDYAKDGNDVVIGHGYEFSDAISKVAEEFPDIYFLVTSTTLTNNKNLGSLNNNYNEAGFLQGAFAALMTKSNVVGAIGGGEIPPIAGAINGFKAGAIYINPSIKVLTVYTGSFDDGNKAKEQALAMISQGADILMTDADHAGKGVYIAAEEKGIYSIGSIKSEYEEYPKNLITCATVDLSKAIFQTIEKIDKGTYNAAFELFGLKQGIVNFTYNSELDSKVPNDVKIKIDEIKENLLSGEIDLTKLIIN